MVLTNGQSANLLYIWCEFIYNFCLFFQPKLLRSTALPHKWCLPHLQRSPCHKRIAKPPKSTPMVSHNTQASPPRLFSATVSTSWIVSIFLSLIQTILRHFEPMIILFSSQNDGCYDTILNWYNIWIQIYLFTLLHYMFYII